MDLNHARLRCSIVPFSAAYMTDEFGMSAFAPLLRDNRTRCARVEFVEPDPNRRTVTPEKPRFPQGHAARPPNCISIYGLPIMCRWAERVPAHIIYAPVSL
jgi:hypothetical protein